MGAFYVLRASALHPGDLRLSSVGTAGVDDRGPSRLAVKSNRQRAGAVEAPPQVVIADQAWRVKAAPQRSDEFAHEVAVQIRRILTGVEEFRRLCRLRDGTGLVVDVLKRVIDAGRTGFTMTAKMRAELSPSDPHAAADEARCTRELEALLQVLRTGVQLPTGELEHAMDSLIMECVKMDAAARESRGARRRAARGLSD